MSSATLLVTAAHIAKDWNSCSLQILGIKNIVPIVPLNQLVFSTADIAETSETKDKLDFALAVLDLPRMKESPGVTAVTPVELDLSDRGDPEQLYGFVGFPGSKNRSWQGRFPNHVVFLAGQLAESSVIARLGLHRDTHLVMNFSRKRMRDESDNLVTAPDPHGMSGGPVFRLGTAAEIRAGTASPKVVAIALRWPEQQLVVGVRIALVIEAVRRILPELSQELPEPKHIRALVSISEG